MYANRICRKIKKNVRFDSDIFELKKKTVESETISSSEKYDYRINYP